jgi:exopolysaccharide production protein ExoQ
MTSRKLTLDDAGCICLLLFYGMLGYIPILMPNTGGALTTSSQSQQVHGVNHIVLFLVWAGVIFILLKSHFHLRLDWISARVAIIYSAYAISSMLWARSASGVLSAGISLIISTLFAIFLAGRYSGEQLTALMGRVIVLLALGSAFLAIGLPKYGLDHFTHSGAWQGVYGQKNGLGLVMSLGTGILLAAKPKGLRETLWLRGGLLLCIAEVGLSRSREAWIAVALMLTVHFSFKLYERFAANSRAVVLLMSSMMTLIIGGVVATLWVDILKLFGRDVTLTGRTVLWAAVLDQCRRHPLNGYGLASFWGTGDAIPIYAKTGWLPTSSHNGFLECLLELGVVGLVLLVILISLGAFFSFKIIARKKEFQSSKSWIYCFSGILLLNMVGDITGLINSICWIFLVCGACSLEEAAHEISPALSMAEVSARSARNMRFEAEVRNRRILNT